MRQCNKSNEPDESLTYEPPEKMRMDVSSALLEEVRFQIGTYQQKATVMNSRSAFLIGIVTVVFGLATNFLTLDFSNPLYLTIFPVFTYLAIFFTLLMSILSQLPRKASEVGIKNLERELLKFNEPAEAIRYHAYAVLGVLKSDEKSLSLRGRRIKRGHISVILSITFFGISMLLGGGDKNGGEKIPNTGGIQNITEIGAPGTSEQGSD